MAVKSAKRSVITSFELKEQLENGAEFVLIDVREPAEFQQGSIPGALLVPLAYLADSLQVDGLAKDAHVVVFCHSGARSARAQQIMRNMGFSQVCNLQGGMLAWERV